MVSDTYLIVITMIALIAIFYMWYITKDRKTIHSVQPTNQNDATDPYVQEDNIDIASQFIARTYGVEIDPELLVMGPDLSSRYFKLTNLTLSQKYIDGIDTLFNVKMAGWDYDIAVIHDSYLRHTLRKNI